MYLDVIRIATPPGPQRPHRAPDAVVVQALGDFIGRGRVVDRGLAERHVPDDRVHAVRGQGGVLQPFVDDLRWGWSSPAIRAVTGSRSTPIQAASHVGRRGGDEHSCAAAGLEDPAVRRNQGRAGSASTRRPDPAGCRTRSGWPAALRGAGLAAAAIPAVRRSPARRHCGRDANAGAIGPHPPSRAEPPGRVRRARCRWWLSRSSTSSARRLARARATGPTPRSPDLPVTDGAARPVAATVLVLLPGTRHARWSRAQPRTASAGAACRSDEPVGLR